MMDNFMKGLVDGSSECSKCNRRTEKWACRRFISENENLPDVVQLDVKRWKQSRNGKILKIQKEIDVPLELNFQVDFMDVSYCLKAFIYHTGMK
jgi:hypothetical protein